MKEEKSTKFNLNKLQNQWRVIMREGMITDMIFSCFSAVQNPYEFLESDWLIVRAPAFQIFPADPEYGPLQNLPLWQLFKLFVMP